MKGKRFNAKKIATVGALTALGLIAFMIESLFPPLPLPGAKMGISNIFSLLALIMYSPVEGFIVTAARTLLGGIFSGNVSTLMYSFTAGMISTGAAALMIYLGKGKFSLLAVSIASAVIHNMVQLAVYFLVTGIAATLSYAPYLALIGIGAGAVVGATSTIIIRLIPSSFTDRLL